MKVYVVIEDDRGAGPHVVGVFRSLEAAQAAQYGSHCWVEECDLEGDGGWEADRLRSEGVYDQGRDGWK